MGWKVFREIARPFEQAAHGLGLSGGGVTRSVMRQGSRSARDAWNFSYKAAKNITAFEAGVVTLGIVKPKWGGTNTAFKAGQAVGITAAAVAGGYALAPYLGVSGATTAAASVNAPAALTTGTMVEASAAPFALDTGISYGAIGTMGSGLGAGTAPLAATMTTAQAAAVSAGSKTFLTKLGETALTTLVVGSTNSLVGLLKPNAPAAGSASGGASSEAGMPLLAGGGEAGGSAEDVLNRFKGASKPMSPVAMVAIGASVLLLTYAVFSKKTT